MTDINKLFRERIGFPEFEKITFEKMELILELTAKTIPFENVCIMNNNLQDLTRESVADKILARNEGGLCYELNSLFHYFLVENGFEADLVYGVVYNRDSQSWSQTGRTHVLNILTHNGRKFLIDTGFGGNLPLKPVPLNGEIVQSRNGDFRVKQVKSEYGDYILEMKLKGRDSVWARGYAFDTMRMIKDVTELNGVQKIISESPFSSFNVGMLLTKFTESGTITLTEKSLTQRINGNEIKDSVDRASFIRLAREHFGIKIVE